MVEVPLQYNASLVLDRNVEAGRAGKVAIRCGDEQVTYGDLLARVCRCGSALQRLGVRREERVVMVLNDTPAFPTVFYGALRIGAVPVPTNPLLRWEDHRYFIQDSYARVVVTDLEHLEKVRQAAEGVADPVTLVVANGRAEGALALDDLLASGLPDLAPASTHRDDMAFILYSSGSTGLPKGVVHLHHDIPYTCETYARHVLQLTDADITYSAAKLFHAYGLGNNMTFPYWAGAATVLVPGRPAPQPVLETIQRFRPTVFFGVPTLYNAILNFPDCTRYDLSSLRLCVSAAEALPAEIWRRWKETFGLVILDGIGTTEMLHIFASNTREALRPGSSGKPVPGYEVKIVDDEGRPVPPGGAGHLMVKGDSAAPYYWHFHEKSKATMVGEWMRTGDWYRMDREGFLWYEGRSDDMLKVGGLWVSPIEVENSLIEHPAVREAAVVGIEVEGLTKMKAFVILREGFVGSAALAAELQEWCKTKLERYEYPQFVEFVADLPRTVTGKIQRFKLRQAHPTPASS
ncbi:MAG: benzoate-CoA ligase family protein [Armatimonadota bacterium]|nr:benzoate-CoA ligase family protein [Armatimonadota bacterium]MDR7427361.1 benzoate-CoA ligase family protein [Armatimonadota bacterium]MDR7464879.1 benzoate-CoA ligase family protein [Armatimonadota bacterium]MDR7468707.1 benzoate-CoA ligase family protein [Armatimonadota bacterium]MDR7474386.1 benzoate-CoA ligase family protein [Armatimonadota bacterium]